MLGDINTKITQLEGVKKKYIKDLSALSREVRLLEHKVVVLDKSSDAIKVVLQSLTHEDVQGIISLITEGLQAIFDDQDLSLRADFSIKRGKINIEFNVYDGLKDIEGDVLGSFGGGVANIVSLLFRFITTIKLKMHPFLALDETLGAVSEEYIDNTGQFLKSLCDKTGFDILLVTHQPKFLSYADTMYLGDAKDSELILKRIGKNSDEDQKRDQSNI